MEDDKLLECAKVRQFCFASPELSSTFATLENQTDHLLQKKRPARSCAEVVKLADRGDAVCTEAFFEVELCLVENQFLVGREEGLRSAKGEEMSSMKRMLSSSMIFDLKKDKKNCDEH